MVVVVVSSGSAHQLQRRVLTDMRKREVVEDGAVCSFVTRSASSGATSIPVLHVGQASHPSAVCWCVGSGKEEERGREGPKQHTMWVSGEDHNQAVAHAATGLGKPDREKKRGGKKGRGKRGVACAPRSQEEKEKRGERGKREKG